MNKINDVRHIIQPLSEEFHINIKKNIDNIFENLIVNNTIIFNNFILNHIIYSDNSVEFYNIIELTIKRHITTNILNQRIHFRKLNKINKLDISNFNTYFNDFYKMLIKVNSIIYHIIPNTITSKKKWGDNIIIEFGIENIINILCNDIIFENTINRNIVATQQIDPKGHINYNKDMFIFNKFLNIFIPYNESYEKVYNKFIDILETSMIENCPIIENIFDMTPTVFSIYNFNNVYKYYISCIYNYKFIKQNENKQINIFITDILKSIISNTDIISLKYFLITYKNEIKNLTKYIDLIVILLSKKPKDINTFITYYYTLYSLYNDTIFIDIINTCIKEDINKICTTKEHIEYIADLINTIIINKDSTDLKMFYYKICTYLNNIDELNVYLCQKLIERIIYTDIDVVFEVSHYEILKKMFATNLEILHKYNIILNDYEESYKYNSLSQYKSNIISFDNIKPNIIITSVDSWNINYMDGHTKNIINYKEFTTILCNFLYNYITKTNKTLVFYPHIGYVDITIGHTNIIMLPFHMFCVEQFTDMITEIKYSDVFDIMKHNMSNYMDNTIDNIIKSLIIGKVLLSNNNMLSIRNDMPIYINMISIYNTINFTINTPAKLIEIELAHSRYDIISTNINHYIKVKPYTTDILFKLVCGNIKQFTVTQELFYIAIEKMCKSDYIKKENDMYIKLFF